MLDSTKFYFAAVAALLLTASPISAEPGDSVASREGWLERSQLTGDWDGVRTSLGERGVALYASYTAGVWANLRGGFATGARYEGFARWGIDTDLEKLLGWKGLRFHLGWNSYHGGLPSSELVGVFPTAFLSGWEAEVFVRFYEIFVEKTWRDGRFRLKLGQLAADDDFFVARNADTLLNAAFGYLSLGRDQQIAPFYPLAAPGIYLYAEPFEKWSARVGVYTADPGNADFGNFGFGWGFDNGPFVLAEVGTERRLRGRRGRYSLGAAGTSARGIDFATGEQVSGGWGLYAMIDQALLVDTDGEERLGAFLRAQVIPTASRSLARYVLDGGLKLKGPIPGRELDVASIGASFVRFGQAYVASLQAAGTDVSPQQVSLELTYRARITAWLTLQPDLQLFFDPHLSRRDAVAIGLRAVIEL